jgi:hypothetical protein
MGAETKPGTDSKDQEPWTIICPDRFCKAELPYTYWIKRGFLRCPKCGMLCCLLPSGETVKLCSLGVYVRW